ncbi:MAG: hypothetical protein QOE96_3708 [Blastocatellia bacterium]|jgi:hypothetical protein|nr:hypothetical protein [Blastocatellia bacterium]
MRLLSNNVLIRIIIVAVILSCGESASPQTNSTVRSSDEIVVTRLTDDASMIQFNPMVIDYSANGQSSPKDHAIFQASFIKSSKAPFVSNFFTLWFHSTSRACRYPTTKFVVRVRADDQTIQVGSDSRLAKSGEIASTFSEPENGCVESLWVHLHKETFLKIANAHNVDVRIGSLTFRLDAKHLRALQELARQM